MSGSTVCEASMKSLWALMVIKIEIGLILSFALSQTSNNFSNEDLNRDLSFGRKDKSSKVLVSFFSSQSWDILVLAICLYLIDVRPNLWVEWYFKTLILDLELSYKMCLRTYSPFTFSQLFFN